MIHDEDINLLKNLFLIKIESEKTRKKNKRKGQYPKALQIEGKILTSDLEKSNGIDKYYIYFIFKTNGFHSGYQNKREIMDTGQPFNKKSPKSKAKPKIPEREQLLNFVSKFKDLIMSASPNDEKKLPPRPPKFHGRFVRADSKTEKEMLKSRGSRVVNYFNDSMANTDTDRATRHSQRSIRSRKASFSKRSIYSQANENRPDPEALGQVDRSLGGVWGGLMARAERAQNQRHDERPGEVQRKAKADFGTVGKKHHFVGYRQRAAEPVEFGGVLGKYTPKSRQNPEARVAGARGAGAEHDISVRKSAQSHGARAGGVAEPNGQNEREPISDRVLRYHPKGQQQALFHSHQFQAASLLAEQ